MKEPKNITEDSVVVDVGAMSVSEQREYTGEVEDIRIRSSSLPGLFNPHLPGKELSRSTYIETIHKVCRLLDDGKVCAQYQSVEKPKANFKIVSFNFACLLFVAVSYKSHMIAQGCNPRMRELVEINESMVKEYLNRIDLYNWIREMFYGTSSEGGRLYVGKSFPFYFAEEGIRCHKSSFYAWSNQNPSLPKFQNSRMYTEEEFDCWRQFLKSKRGRQLFTVGKV